MRPELQELPERMRGLPVDKRGYPVPWFVAWVNGEPEFRALDTSKWNSAVREKLCWVCGGKLGSHKAFVIGPMCAINRVSSEPPSHLECAQWSARNCPFLSRPKMVRRENDMDEQTLNNVVGGIAIKRNPGVTMLWVTRSYKVSDDGKGGALIDIGDPEFVEWYREGRQATRSEVDESVATGLPSLRAAIDMEPAWRRKEAERHFADSIARAEALYPL